tara:strand:- start:597 stop:1445 length:849 start_codon:yes stop_codon:yes gene_type:complete
MKTLETTFYYINLKGAEERDEFMKSQAGVVGIDQHIDRFCAIDASTPECLEATGYRSGGWRSRWSLTRTEIAVFESHRALWNRVAMGSDAAAVIMEDDIFLSPKIKDVVAIVEASEIAFDVIRLDGCSGKHRYGPPINNNHPNLREILQTVPSAACYMVSKEGAVKLLKGSEAYCDHVDDYLFSPERNWRCFQSWPAVAIQGMFSNVIDQPQVSMEILNSVRSSAPSEKSAPDKGPIAYRLAKEAKRFFVKCRRRFGGDKRLVGRGGVVGYPPLAEGLPEYR